MADVWDEHWFGSTKTLDVHVAALRRRLDEAATAAGAAPVGSPPSAVAAIASTAASRGGRPRLPLRCRLAGADGRGRRLDAVAA